MLTAVPVVPEAGVMDEMVGAEGGEMLNALFFAPDVPSLFVTRTFQFPVAAVAGIVNVHVIFEELGTTTLLAEISA